MKAAMLRTIPGRLEIEDVDVDVPAPDEVLVRTAAAGVCHSDLHFMEGSYRHPVPAVLGHESAGVVEAVGPGVTAFAPGDHVIACLSVFCGSCDYCLRGSPHLCAKEGLARDPAGPQRLRQGGGPVWQFLNVSGFAEQMLLHQNAIVKIRADMPLDRAALIGCGVVTGLGAIFNTARVRPGETVAVIGCGGIGLNAVQGAAIAGANRIVAVDRVASKLELARRFGATDVVDASTDDPVDSVVELTGGGVDHAIEAIGLAATAEQAFGMTARGGTATIVGMIPRGDKVQLEGSAFLAEKRIQGSVMGSNRFRIDMPRYVEMYFAGRLKLDELVSATFPLERINDAYDALRDGEVARQLVTFS